MSLFRLYELYCGWLKEGFHNEFPHNQLILVHHFLPISKSWAKGFWKCPLSATSFGEIRHNEYNILSDGTLYMNWCNRVKYMSSDNL